VEVGMRTFIIRRIIILIPLFVLISVFIFVVIQLPPGSYVDNYVLQLRAQGEEVSEQEIEAITRMYGLDQPVHVQYWRWFTGFITGDLGYSLAFKQPVGEIIRTRIGFTVLISVLVLLFQWIISIPVGVYSAIRKYTVGDYIVTFLGFIGLSVPNFMLALIIMYVGYRYFGANLTGLFSVQYIDAPWSIAKFLDMLSNIWVAIIVVGTAGTASFIRVLRAQMLDELGKAYVQTARAKGLRESIVIMKHAFRVAVNPVISTIGWILPRIFSSGAITAIVLGLPTLGPALLDAILAEDMYLAGDIILIQTILVLIGTLISDISLALVDPRIRYE
jgi:peptide/nickel transport system permease protein